MFSAAGQRVEMPNHRFCRMERGLERIRGKSVFYVTCPSDITRTNQGVSGGAQ